MRLPPTDALFRNWPEAPESNASDSTGYRARIRGSAATSEFAACRRRQRTESGNIGYYLAEFAGLYPILQALINSKQEGRAGLRACEPGLDPRSSDIENSRPEIASLIRQIPTAICVVSGRRDPRACF